MQKYRKKPIMVNLVAALIMCLLTFIIGFTTSSFVLLDSRIENAQEKISELNVEIDEKKDEIKALTAAIDEKNKNNVTLGEKIQEQAVIIEKLNSNVSTLEHDVESISEAAINGTVIPGGTLINTFVNLEFSQQVIILFALFILLILIISVTCAFIASKQSKGADKSKAQAANVENEISDVAEYETIEEAPVATEAAYEEYDFSQEDSSDFTEDNSVAETEEKQIEPSSSTPVVDEAIDLLYHNNLEDNISRLGGFKFGITNFDEVLSDKARGKAFGNSESGDFVAFMSTASQLRKLYIIPRHMALSDSSVVLRGTTDLFDITDESGRRITSGTVRIKAVDAPAVFVCGENGWAIESKGSIISLSGNN